MNHILKNRTLSAAIGDQIRQDILDGTHSSGTQLRQDMLAAAFGVSRIPVREALFQLEAEGFVQIEPHKGAVVTNLSPAEVEDVFALRILLEPRLLRASIGGLTQGDHARLDSIQASFGVAIKSQNASRWGALNAELHLAMYARAGLPRTLSIVAGLLQTSERYTRIQLATKAAWQRAQNEHAELIALCRIADSEAACSLLVQHIATVRQDLATLLSKRLSRVDAMTSSRIPQVP
jgi:DNA-binding GntR family transcriptional regulator